MRAVTSNVGCVKSSSTLVTFFAATIAELLVNEIVHLIMVWIDRPRLDDLAFFLEEPFAFCVPLRKLQPFLAP